VDTPGHPHADGSVRVALPSDGEAIARVQAAAFRHNYSALLPAEVVEHFDEPAAVASWRYAIEAPPTPRHRVLVAIDASGVVGFAASAPGSDEDLDDEHDAELLAIHVAPDHMHNGHGSRLMAAVVDHAHDDGFSRLVCWVFAADDPLRMFMTANGWAPDGSTRDLDVGELLHQVRLHTAIRDSSDLIA
jgi:GNAT superfamily N-acetyltransferase